jgi:hypothetical protein
VNCEAHSHSLLQKLRCRSQLFSTTAPKTTVHQPHSTTIYCYHPGSIQTHVRRVERSGRRRTLTTQARERNRSAKVDHPNAQHTLCNVAQMCSTISNGSRSALHCTTTAAAAQHYRETTVVRRRAPAGTAARRRKGSERDNEEQQRSFFLPSFLSFSSVAHMLPTSSFLPKQYQHGASAMCND